MWRMHLRLCLRMMNKWSRILKRESSWRRCKRSWDMQSNLLWILCISWAVRMRLHWPTGSWRNTRGRYQAQDNKIRFSSTRTGSINSGLMNSQRYLNMILIKFGQIKKKIRNREWYKQILSRSMPQSAKTLTHPTHSSIARTVPRTTIQAAIYKLYLATITFCLQPHPATTPMAVTASTKKEPMSSVKTTFTFRARKVDWSTVLAVTGMWTGQTKHRIKTKMWRCLSGPSRKVTQLQSSSRSQVVTKELQKRVVAARVRRSYLHLPNLIQITFRYCTIALLMDLAASSATSTNNTK